MLELLNNLDTRLFLFINGMHNSVFDFIMFWASDRFIWIPFYAVFAWLLIRLFKKKFLLIALMVLIMIVLSDQISAHLIKPLVMRLRPCHNMLIAAKIHLHNNACGGKYGFVSSHATSCFTFAVFVVLLAGKQLPYLKYILLPWALFVSYSRVYLGVHYPGDILGGAILGSSISYGMYRVFLYIEKSKKMNRYE